MLSVPLSAGKDRGKTGEVGRWSMRAASLVFDGTYVWRSSRDMEEKSRGAPPCEPRWLRCPPPPALGETGAAEDGRAWGPASAMAFSITSGSTEAKSRRPDLLRIA